MAPAVAELEVAHAIGTWRGVLIDELAGVQPRTENPARPVLGALDHNIVRCRSVFHRKSERVRHAGQGVRVDRQHWSVTPSE